MDQNNEPPRMIFEDKEFQRHAQSLQTQILKIIPSVIKYSGGYIKDKKQARYTLLGFVAIAIIFVSILVFSDAGNNAKIEAPPGQKIIYPENAPPRLQEGF